MKKFFIKTILFISIGYVIGIYLFKSKFSIIKYINNKELYYFLEEEGNKKNIVNSNNIYSVVDYKNKEFYIYRGICKNYDACIKISKVLNNNGIDVNVREVYLNNREFSYSVSQFDNLINKGLDDDEVLKVEEVVLSNYDQYIKNEFY